MKAVWIGAYTAFAFAFAWVIILWTGAYAPEPSLPLHRTGAALDHNGPVRITVFGTSLTRNGDWPDSLAARLSACSGRQVYVTRIAKVGANSGWGRTQVEKVAATAPDLVLMEFAINDADMFDGQTRAESRSNNDAILDGLGRLVPDARVVLMTTNTTHGLRGLIRPWLSAYYADYRLLAEQQGVGLIDLSPIWARSLAGGGWHDLQPDGLHPTTAAVAAIALPVLVEQLDHLLGGCVR